MSYENDFNAAYVLSKPPAVQAVINMPITGIVDGSLLAKMTAARAAALAGNIIDVEIDVYNGGAYGTMTKRITIDGFLWTPSALMTVTDMTQCQKLPIPPGGIKSDNLIQDYPPFIKPAPPPPVDALVGNYMGCTSDEISPAVLPSMSVFISNSLQHYAEGSTHTMTAAGGSGLLNAGDIVQYHLLGSDLMDPQDRIGVWLGPVVASKK